MTDENQAVPGAAPENPFGDGGRQIAVTVPVDFTRLHAELDAALPDATVQSALRHPLKGEPCAEDPAFLSWIPAGLSEATVKQIIDGHDPTLPRSPDMTTHIGGSGLAEGLHSLRELLAEGKPLGNEELTSGLALLIQAITPSP